VEVSEKKSAFKGLWIGSEEQMLQLALERSLPGQVIFELFMLQWAVQFGYARN